MQQEQSNTTSKKVKAKRAVSRVEFIDTESGEVLDGGKMIYVQPRMRIKGFFMADQKGFEKLAKSRLTREGYRVLMFLMGRMDFENVITINRKEIAEALSMKRQNVARAIQSLRDAGVFEGETKADLVVNLASELGWKGKVQNLHKRNANAFKDCGERTAPTDADWKKMDERIDALPKFSEAAPTI